ncbi:hypothetical protein [Sphingobium nicotianae]|uniref:Uncharacterized protein n=1 Tax=Sphingobium nicotianae TaxID=2782607 RepID=A0A9X1ISJ7_9SPHN|nr:hypothetical protein [Sphingobium nicotianae]MBT2188656.1 hypothetical protein [Sphingobium nicotianae]
MAGRFVIDTNWLSDAALTEFLARSAADFAVIPEMTLVEVHKDAAAKNGRKLLQTLCGRPRQVIILRGTHDLYRDSGVSKGLCNRLIEPAQTANFGAYCRTVIDVADDDLTNAHFSLMEEQSRDQIADLRANVGNILTLFERCTTIFEKGDLDRLRKRIPYSGDLQRKLIHLSMDMHKMLLRSLNIQPQFHPRDLRRALDTFVFRYALCVVIFLTRWIRQGETKTIKEERLVNHVMDLKTVAVATFFDGLKTHDEMPRDVHREVKFILGAIGAYVNCGNGPRR